MHRVHQEQIDAILQQLGSHGVRKIIAFSGSVPSGLETAAENVVAESFEVYKGLPIAIQTGGTKFDIQKYAADRAKRCDMPLIGVYPSRGLKYRLDNLDFAIEVSPRYGESEWGDETEIFAKLPDGVEVIGGSFGTLTEFGHLMKINDSKIKAGRSPTYIAPVRFAEKRTFADLIAEFQFKPEQKVCLPDYDTSSGTLAAEFLTRKLGLK